MSASSLLDLFRSRWQEMAHQLWPQTAREQAKAELARLDVELARRQHRLLHCRKRIEKLHNDLKRRENRLAQLAALVQQTPTAAAALAELECWRGRITRLHDRVQEREHRYARQLARFGQQKQVRAELRERLLSGSLPKAMDDSSDPDYLF